MEIDQSCNERLARIIPAMAKQKNVTETLKAADQMEWVRDLFTLLLNLFLPSSGQNRFDTNGLE